MKPEYTVYGQPTAAGKSREIQEASGAAAHNPDGVTATHLLVELGQCQRGISALLHAALATLGPIARQTLPSVAFTLTGLIHATELAANEVLDQAEQLAKDRDRLGKALTRLEPYVGKSDPATRRAWTDVMECSQVLSTHLVAIMSAMAFQDLTSQHLAGTIKAVEGIREQVTEVLVMLDLPVEPAEPALQQPGSPLASSDESRQALTDELWGEMRDR